MQSNSPAAEPLCFKVDIDVSNEAACKDILRKALPSWGDSCDITLRTLVGGYTNTLFKATVESAEPQTVLLRFFGEQSDNFIDRSFEEKIVLELGRLGLAPPLYAKFNNGCIYGYTEGRPLHERELPEPNIQDVVAAELARWHMSKIPSIPQQSVFFDTLRRWAELDSGHFELDLLGKMKITVKGLIEEINHAEHLIAILKSPVVLSHNDLLPGNIILNEKRGVAQFIDQEYARYNYRGFDIGNHFCEYLGFDGYDYSKFPSLQVRESFIRAYLRHTKQDVTQQAVEQLLLESDVFALLANVHWGLWSLYQSKVSENRFKFDYLRYAKDRLIGFYEHKDRVYAALKEKSVAK